MRWHCNTLGFMAAACVIGAVASIPPASAAPRAGEWCARLTPRLPGVSKADCQKSELAPTDTKSRRGFPILARDLLPPGKDGAGKAGPLRILLIGGIHGDELTSSAIVFKWLPWMQKPEAARFHWRVAPIVNPDGLLAVRPQRVNASGVDLNRNFPTPGWHREAPSYWARRTGSDPRRFPGKTPLSEPESRWVNEQIEQFRPHLIVSIHAPFGVLDLDGPAPPPRRFGSLMFNPVGIYPGSLGNYSGLHKNIPVITIELPNAGTMPPENEVARIWQDMLKWIDGKVAQAPSSIAGS